MKNLILLAALSACLLLGGCVSLLERSYSVVEPYADRYWDSAAEDTLKAENYQDLVNSLLMQVEQRAEECVIRGYGEAAGYGQARSASWEVRRETIPGSYLLENMTFDYEPSDGYSTFTFRMSYREDAEDIEAMMSLSDCQSLVDLLRLSVREDHHRLTARFIRDMRREEVRAAVEALWQELCRGEKEDVPAPPPEDAGPPQEPADGEEFSAQETPPSNEAPEEEPALSEEPEEPSPDTDAPPEEEPPPEDGELPQALEASAPPEEPVEIPPCPWTVRFYPDMDGAGIVEVLLPERPPV